MKHVPAVAAVIVRGKVGAGSRVSVEYVMTDDGFEHVRVVSVE